MTSKTRAGGPVVGSPELPAFERPRITGDQYVALSESEAVEVATRRLLGRLIQEVGMPLPLAIALGPIFADYKSALIEACVSFEEAEVEAAIRRLRPGVAADFDQGATALESALKEVGSDDDAVPADQTA